MATRTKASVPPPDGVVLSREDFEELSERANHQLITQDDPPPDDDEIEETASDRVARMLADLATDDTAAVHVFKITGPNKYAFASKYAPDEYEAGGLAMIRDSWGPGLYQIRLYGTLPGTKRFVVRGKQDVEVLPQMNPKPSDTSGGELGAVLRALSERIDKIAAQPPVDPMASMSAAFAMMKTMREAMGPVAAPPPPPSLLEQMEQLKALRELAADISPERGDDKEPSLTSMLPGVLELVSKGMEQRTQQNPPPLIQHAPQLRAVSQPVTIQQPQQPQGQEPVSTEQQELAAHLEALVKMANENAPIETAADLLYEKMPDEMIELMALPQWFSVLQRFAPQLAAYEKWCTAVRDRTLAMFNEPEEPEQPATPGASQP